MEIAAVSLGSNIGDKRGHIAAAIDLLAETRGLRVVARSGDYRTAPWGFAEQDWFVNACVLLETALAPRALLDRCLEIEHALGRLRDVRWGPRIIDLDLLSYGGRTIEEPGLSVPHPHMLERAFVLVPLAEIAPDLVVGSETVRDALDRVATDDITKL